MCHSIFFVETFDEIPYFLLNVFVKTFVKQFLLKECVLCKLQEVFVHYS